MSQKQPNKFVAQRAPTPPPLPPRPSGLTNGERGLVIRALRYYIHSERRAVQDAALAPRKGSQAKHDAHAADVKRQAEHHIEAAEALLTKLMPQSTEKE